MNQFLAKLLIKAGVEFESPEDVQILLMSLWAEFGDEHLDPTWWYLHGYSYRESEFSYEVVYQFMNAIDLDPQAFTLLTRFVSHILKAASELEQEQNQS